MIFFDKIRDDKLLQQLWYVQWLALYNTCASLTPKVLSPYVSFHLFPVTTTTYCTAGKQQMQTSGWKTT